MKKWTLFLGLYFCLCLLLGGCGVGSTSGAMPEKFADTEIDPDQDETPSYLTCRIVDGAAEGNLLLAELEDGLYGGHDGLHDGRSVYRLTVTEDMAVTLDGAAASAADLQDGMPVDAIHGKRSSCS